MRFKVSEENSKATNTKFKTVPVSKTVFFIKEKLRRTFISS